MAKQTITQQEYFQLEGLMLLARQAERATTAYVKAFEDVLEPERDEYGYAWDGRVADAVYGGPASPKEVPELLGSLGIEVEK